MAENQLALHFPALDLGEADLAELGLSFCHISIFDHWLSEQEAADSQVMSYTIALETGAVEMYLQGEKKFLDFYSSLSSMGVVCNRPRPARVFDAFVKELRQVVVDSLRETRFMDVYFKSAGARVMGRYDRTDLLIADSRHQLEAVRQKAQEFHLFVLT